VPATESPTTPASDEAAATPSGGAPTGQQPPTRRVKRQPTAGDMIRSLAVLLIPVLAITVIFTRDPDRPSGTERVDWQAAHGQAVEEAGFDVLAPTNMPEGWTSVRVAWEQGDRGADQRWMVGWLSPQQIYFALEQSNAATRPFVDRVTREGVADGSSTVGGTTWQRYVSPDDRTRALVRVEDRATTIVVADASYEALEAFAGTLR